MPLFGGSGHGDLFTPSRQIQKGLLFGRGDTRDTFFGVVAVSPIGGKVRMHIKAN